MKLTAMCTYRTIKTIPISPGATPPDEPPDDPPGPEGDEDSFVSQALSE